MTNQQPSILSISQSLLKRYWDYLEGKECGHAMHQIDMLHKYVRTPTPRMIVGTYMEYLISGAKNRDGTTPEPVKTKTGISADSQRAKIQAGRCKELLKEENFTVTEVGKVLEIVFPDQGYKIKGVLDILGEYEGKVSILDIKSSGLIGNEWEEYGWSVSTFNMRKKLTIQVVFYKYLAWKVLGIRDIPFFFAIHSSTNEYDSEFWEVQLSDFDVSMSHFEDMIMEIVPDLQMSSSFGFTAYPESKRCATCPVKKDCEYKRNTPEKKIVVIDGIYP